MSIIKQNDLHQVRQFIVLRFPEDDIVPRTLYLEDALFNAASYGSTEALHILLEAPEVVLRFIPQFRLMLNAYATANADVVRFILDSHITVHMIGYRSGQWVCIREMTLELLDCFRIINITRTIATLT